MYKERRRQEMTSKYTNLRSLTILDQRQWRFLPFRHNRFIGNSASATSKFVAPGALLNSIGGFSTGLAMVVLITLFYRNVMAVNMTTVGFTFLVAILSASTI